MFFSVHRQINHELGKIVKTIRAECAKEDAHHPIDESEHLLVVVGFLQGRVAVALLGFSGDQSVLAGEAAHGAIGVKGV